MYFISDNKEYIQLHEVKRLLEQSYWANKRSLETIQVAIENSLCFGVYLEATKQQVGFARVLTDYATSFYLCDVIIDEAYRGNGMGKALMERIVTDQRLKSLKGLLITKDAHKLYENYGFEVINDRFMGLNLS